MFTGLVEDAVEVVEVADHAGGRRVTLDVGPLGWEDLVHGESVAVNGCCLTVADFAGGRLSFDAVRETLDKTNLGDLSAGAAVHVERALRVGDRLGGHFVLGHVDGPAEVLRHDRDPDDWRIACRVPADLAEFLVPKGSVAIDGVSLTIAALDGDDLGVFEVALIPTTLAKTALGDRPVGYRLNFEADVLTKTVVQANRRMRGG